MSRRTSDLLQEMQGIFGGGFGDSERQSLTEADDMLEAQRPMPRRFASDKGLLSKNKKDLPVRGGKSGHPGLTLKQKRKMKAKKAGDEKTFQGVMKDIRGEMDKSHKKSTEKSKTAKASGATSAGSSSSGHYPFKRSDNLGLGPDKDKHNKSGCWKCNCGPIYSKGCDCTSSGKGKNCPPAGTEKHITYHADKHNAYNKRHHACTGETGKKIGCGSSWSGGKKK